MKKELDDFNFGVIICDECHYLKNQRAARTKVMPNRLIREKLER